MPRALAPLAVAYAFVFASTGIQLPFLTPALSALGFPLSAIGAMWAARNLMMVISPPLWGALADRRGSARPFLVATLLCGAALLFLLSRVETRLQGVLVFAAYGLLAAPTGSLLDGMTLTALGPHKRRFGRVRVYGTVGFGVSALLVGFLVDRGALPLSAKALFPLSGACFLVAAVVVMFAPALPTPKLQDPLRALAMFRNRRVVLLLVGSTLLWASHGAYSSVLAPLAEATGGGSFVVGTSMFVAVAVEVVALGVGGAVLDRLGGRRVLVLVAAVAVLRWLLLSTTTSIAGFVALQALHGVTFGLYLPTAVTLLAEEVGDDVRQSAQGIFTSISFGVGGGGGALLAGVVLERSGASATWLSMAALAGAGLVVAALFEERARGVATPRAG